MTRVLDFDSSMLTNEMTNIKKEVRLIEKNIEALHVGFVGCSQSCVKAECVLPSLLQELKQQITNVNKEKEDLLDHLFKLEANVSALEVIPCSE